MPELPSGTVTYLCVDVSRTAKPREMGADAVRAAMERLRTQGLAAGPPSLRS